MAATIASVTDGRLDRATLEVLGIPINTEPRADGKLLDLEAEASDAAVIWAAAKLADLPVTIRYCVSTQVSAWQMPDGEWFRHIGSAWVRLEATDDHEAGFFVKPRVGATDDDLEWLLSFVERAKEGLFLGHGWEENSERGWFEFTCSRGAGDLVSWARRRHEYIVPCNEPGCDDFGRHHLTDDLKDPWYSHGKQGPNGSASCMRMSNADRWVVYVDTYGSEFSAEEVAGYISDLQWVVADCRQLNAALATAEREAIAIRLGEAHA